jgi:hypothetical protein
MSEKEQNDGSFSVAMFAVAMIFVLAALFATCWRPSDFAWSECQKHCHGQPQSVTMWGCGCFPPGAPDGGVQPDAGSTP